MGGSAHTIFLYFYNDAIWGGATLVTSAEDYSNAAEITLEIQYRDASNELVYKRLTKTLADLVVQGEDQIKSAAAVTTLAYLISGQASWTMYWLQVCMLMKWISPYLWLTKRILLIIVACRSHSL